MAERNLNTALKKRLINNEPFVYAHLIKYERPHGANKDGKHSTDAKRYAYLTDGAVNIDFNDGSFATDGTTANGTQTYVADKIAKIGSYSETIEAKATGMTLTISAESLNNSFYFKYPVITSDLIDFSGNNHNAGIDLISLGFREGDKVLLTTDDNNKNNGKEVRVAGIKGPNNDQLIIETIDSALVTSIGEEVTIKIVSDELKGPLTEMNDATLKSYHNRDVFIYKAFLDPDTYAIIGAPILVFKGIIASTSLQDNPNKNLTVNWKLTSHWGDFAQVNGRPTSDAVHRAIDENGNGQPDVALKDVYASDLGFSHADITLSTMSTYKYMEKVPELVSKKKGIFGLRRKYTQIWVDEERTAQVDLNWSLSAKYLPVVYGVDLVEGIPIFVDTENGDSTQVYVAYAICEGEIGGIFDFYFDDHPRICLNIEDSDARKSGGTEESAEVTCIGRADLGTVLGGQALVDFDTAVPGITEILNMLSSNNSEGTRGGKSTDMATAKRYLHYYNMQNAYNSQSGMDASADTGILHEQTHEVKTPNEMFLTFHAGLTHQRANDTLVSVANANNVDDAGNIIRFKRQTDYYNGPDYWGPNHTLSDTAYVLVKCTIGEDDESVPETKYVVRGKLIDCHNYDFSYKHNDIPLYQYGGSEVELADGNEAPSQTWSIGDTVDLKRTDTDATINSNVIIIDKWDTVTNQGKVENRFRFSDAPELSYSNGIPSITSFYMQKGSNKFHFVTSNHVDDSGTVPSALTAVGTTSISSDKPIITFSSAPTWAWDSGAETFPKVNVIDDDLVPIAFIEGYDYDGNSYMAKQSSSGTILTILGTSKDNYVAASNVDVIRTDAIQLASSASAVDNQYNGMRIELTTIDSDGDYTIQKREIVDYDGSLKVAQVNIPWDKNKFPKQNATSTYTYKVLSPKDQRVSTNPAIQLLDYSTSETYGKRLDLDIDIELGSWLSAARTCDSRGTQKCYGSSLSATAGHRYVLTHDGTYNGNIIAMGKVKNTASSATNVEFEEVYGKFTKTFMADRHNYVVGDIIANHGGYYRVGTAGTQPAKTATVAATTSNSTTVTIETGGSISSSQVVFGLGIREHVTVSSVSGTTVTLSSAQSLVAGTKLYFCSNLTRLTSFNIHKLGATDANTAIALTRTTDGTYDDTTEYSIYNSDFIRYWRQLGWESHHQRWVTRHQACTTLDTSNSVFNNMNGMLQQFNGILSFEAGKYALRIEVESDDTEQTSDIATSSDTGYTIGTELNHRYITDDNIIGTIKVSDPGPKKSYNTVSSTISDPGSKFEGKQVSFYNSDFLRADKNVIKSGNFAQSSIHNYYNARINVENYLKQSRYQTKVNFTLGPRGLLLVTGDVISLTHNKFGWNQKQFRIENLNFKTNCTVDVSASEYDDSFYTITTPTLESNQIPNSRTPVPYSLSTPANFTASAGNVGQIDLVWKNAANLPSNSVTEIWYATGDTSDISLRTYLASVTAAPKVVNQVNGAVSSTTVAMDSVTGLVAGMVLRGTAALDTASVSNSPVTISSISGNNLTISASQTIPDNTRLTFLSPGEFTHYIGTNGSDKTYWLRHSYTDVQSGKPYNSDFTVRRAVTSVLPSTLYQLIVQADTQNWKANSAGAIQSPDYIKFTPDTNLSGNITWGTSGDVNNNIPIYTATSGGSDIQETALGNTVPIYLRKADVTANGSNTKTYISATITPTSTEISNGATNANYVNTKVITRVDDGADGAGNSVHLEASDYSIVYNAAGSSPSFTGSGGNINLTATSSGFTDPYYRFTIAGSAGSWVDGGNTSTFTVPTSIFSPSKVIKVEVKDGSGGSVAASDSISIYPVQPGATGGAGTSHKELQIYKATVAGASAIPTTPSGGSYNFSNDTLTLPSGWTNKPGTVWGGYTWVSIATASAAAGGTDSSIIWSGPISTSFGQAVNLFYKRQTTMPTKPLNDSTNVGSIPSGWDDAIGGTSNSQGSAALWQLQGISVPNFVDGGEENFWYFHSNPVQIESVGNGYTVICTNESVGYSASKTGAVTVFDNSGTSFEVFRGSTQLTGVLTGTPTVDQFKVEATATGITRSSQFGASVSGDGAVVFANHTAGAIMAGTGNTSAEISYSIAISTGVQAETVTKKQTFTKTLAPEDPPIGYPTYISTDTITRDTEGAYSATYLDIDFTFNEAGTAVARDRFRINRSSDTWSTSLTAGTHASSDLNAGRLATAVTATAKAAVLKVTYSHGGVSTEAVANVKITHDGETATSLNVSSSNPLFSFKSSNDSTPDPATITVKANQQNQASNLATGDLAVTNGSKNTGSYSGSDGTGTYTWTVTPSGTYPVTCVVSNDSLSDTVIIPKVIGTASLSISSSSPTFGYDDSSDTSATPTTATITAVQQNQTSNLVDGDLTTTGNIESSFSYSGSDGTGTATWTITPTSSQTFPIVCTISNDSLSETTSITKVVGGDTPSAGTRGYSIFTIEESTDSNTSAANAANWVGTLNESNAEDITGAVIALADDNYIRPNDRITVTDNSASTAGTRIYTGSATGTEGDVDHEDFSSLVTETFPGSVIVDGTLAAAKLTSDFVYTKAMTVGSGNNVFKVNTDGDIWSGHATESSAPFQVNNTGNLNASTVTLGSTSGTALSSGSGAAAVKIFAPSSGTSRILTVGGTASQTHIPLTVSNDGTGNLQGFNIFTVDGTKLIDATTGFTDNVYTEIAQTLGTAVTTVSKTSSNVADADGQKITLDAQQDLTIKVRKSSNMFGFDLNSNETTALANAKADIPDQFTLQIYHSLDSDFDNASDISSGGKTFYKTTSSSQGTDKYRLTTWSESEPGFTFAEASILRAAFDNDDVITADDYFEKSITYTTSADEHWFWAVISGGSGGNGVGANNVSNTAATRVLEITATSGNFYIGDDGEGSEASGGDITAVVAGTGLSGGANSGSATLNLDLSEFSAVTPTSGDSFATLDSNGSTEQRTTIDALATLMAGTNITASNGVLSASGGGGGSGDIEGVTAGTGLSGGGTTGTVTLNNAGVTSIVAGSNVSISGATGAVTITSTDTNTNTTYSAGTGITLSSTTFSTNDSQIAHDSLSGFVAAEHIDWTADQGGTNIHSGNYTDTNTTYSVGAGGLTQQNFTTTLKNKLDGIAASANNYSHPGYDGDDISIDTGALSGATVISDIDFNVTTDTSGHVTDATLTTLSTRNLTYGDIGAAASSHSHSYDNYSSWSFDTSSNGTDETVTSGDVVRFAAGTGMTVNHSGDTVTFTNTVTDTNTDTNYYLSNITNSGNTYTWVMSGTTDRSIAFGANAFNSTTIATNNNQLANGAGYTTNTGTTTASNTQTFTNKSGNISQWTNDSLYTNNSGDITSVNSSAQNGITAGGTSGAVNVAMSGSYSGDFAATGNITAYSSDERLKDLRNTISKPLDKIKLINGYEFEWNDKARKLAPDVFKEGIEVGVSAQEIQEVIPSVVKPSLHEGYLTVQYEKIVPLLIEAIKELKEEVDRLKENV